jgi:hypothetical protein
MKIFLSVIKLSLFCLATLSKTGLSNPHPINIHCQDSANEPKKVLDLELSPLIIVAHLRYREEQQEPLHLIIRQGPGFHSSSSVTITSTSSGRLNDKHLIKITARSSEAGRISRFFNFSLSFSEQNDGSFKPSNLTYSAVIEEIPDGTHETTLVLDELRCSISGL